VEKWSPTAGYHQSGSAGIIVTRERQTGAERAVEKWSPTAGYHQSGSAGIIVTRERQTGAERAVLETPSKDTSPV